MKRGEVWNRLSDLGWQRMAEDWLAANREEPTLLADDQFAPVSLVVTGMRFDAAPEKLWNFILLVVSQAETDWQIGQIGAALIEHLLGWHGDQYLAKVEAQAVLDQKFARAVLSVDQYLMNEQVWARLQTLQQQIREAKNSSS